MSQQFFELIRPDHNFDFVGKTKPLLISSAILIVLSFLMLPLNMIIPGRGHALNFAIDFRGGTEMRVDFSKPVTPGEIREAMEPVATRTAKWFRCPSSSMRSWFASRLSRR
jgi:preprotein translocase subunit SecF